MARKDIGNKIDRENRNAHNDNYKELYKEVNDFKGSITDELYERIIDGAKLNWKEPVESQSNLPSSATEGDTRMARDTGKVYRYDGSKWVEIQQIDAGPVNELDSRLTSQLAEKVNRDEVNELLGDISDGTPLFADNTEEMSDTSRLYVNTSDGYLYSYDGSEFVSTNVRYQSTGLANTSVSTNKLKDTVKTRNLFSGDYIDGILFHYGPHDMLYAVNNFNGYKGKTAEIKIEPNTTYKLKIHDKDLCNVVRIGLHPNKQLFKNYDGTEESLDLMSPFKRMQYTSNVGDVIPEEFTIISNDTESYLYIYVSNNGQEPKIQVEEGVMSTEYIPHRLFKSDQIEGYYVKKDPVFDSLYMNGILFHYGPTGKLYPLKNYHDYKGKTIVFSVLPNTEYNLVITEKEKSNVVHIGTNHQRVAFGRYDGTESSLGLIVPFDRMLFTSNPGDSIPSEFTIKTNDTDKFLYVYTSNEGKEPVALLDKKIHIAKSDENKFSGFYEDLIGTYPYFEAVGVESGSSTDFMAMNSDDLYDLYDDLMDRHPNNVTKKIIGYGTALDGSEDINLPIYEYKFSPNRAKITTPNKNPTMLLQSLFHGQEISAGAALYQFLVDLYDNTGRIDDVYGVLDFLKNNIDFKVVPIINPYGFNNQLRKNIRGIDTNTNFETDFVVIDDPDYVYYGGEEPMTEQETLTMDRWYRDNSNAIGMVDMHNMAGTHQGGWGGCWGISPSPDTRLVLRNLSESVGRHWRTYDTGFQNAPVDAYLGWADERPQGQARVQAYKKYGIEACTLDTLRVVNFKDGAVNFDKYSVQLAADFLGATVVSMIKNFAM